MNYESEFVSLIESVTSAAEKPICRDDFEIVDWGVPHKPPNLPTGKMAVYVFIHDGRFLKIGKVSAKNNARYQYMHYNPGLSSVSTLAKSILNDRAFLAHQEISENGIGEWIRQSCRRIDILLDGKFGVFALNLIESALQYRYEPKYEGFASQR